MADLSTLTAKDFSAAMHKGYETLEWCEGQFFIPGWFIWKARACAVGSMAHALRREPLEVVDALWRLGLDGIPPISDRAGNKHAAMKAVDAVLLAKVQP